MRKFIAVFISLAMLDGGFLSGDIRQDHPAKDVPLASISDSLLPSSFDPLQIARTRLGAFMNVGEVCLPSDQNKPFFIHIRDLHCNFEAQENIAKALEIVASESGIVDRKNKQQTTDPNPQSTIPDLLVLTEGADGPEDTSLLGTFPDKRVREEGSKAFMKEGKMTGAEFLSIVKYGDIPMRIEGVEDADLYVENLKVFQNVMIEKDNVKDFVDGIKDVLMQVKEKVYSGELKALEKKEDRYQAGQEGVDVYAAYLKEIYLKFLSSEPARTKEQFTADFPNLSLFLEITQAHQAISTQAVETERTAAMEALSQKLPKEELGRLIKQSLEYRLGKINGADFWRGFFELVEKNLDLKDYQTLAKYVQLMKKENNLDHEKFMTEMENLTAKLKTSLMTSEDEKKIADLGQRMEVLKKLLNLEMSREDLEFYQAHQTQSSVGNIVKELKEFSQNNGAPFSKIDIDEEKIQKVETLQKAGEEFYELALKRDHMMAGKALKAVDSKLGMVNSDTNEVTPPNLPLENKGRDSPLTLRGVRGVTSEGSLSTIHYPQVTVLITGGFHSDGVTKLLKEAGAGFIVLTPKIQSEVKMTNYFNLMMDQKLRVGTIDFVHLFGEKLARRFPEMTHDMMREVVGDFVRLGQDHRVGQSKLSEWVDGWGRAHSDRADLLSELRSLIGGVKEAGQALVMSAELVQELMTKYSRTTAELTLDVLREMNHPLIANAERLLAARPDNISTPVPAPAGQMGKRARVQRVEVIDSTRARATVRDSSGNEQNLDLENLGYEEKDFGDVVLRINTIAEDARTDIKRFINGLMMSLLTGRNFPRMHSYLTLIDDLAGFYQDGHIGIHERFIHHPIALFHEIGEFLIAAERLSLTWDENSREIVAVFDGQTSRILIQETDALAIVQKGPQNPHYLLRVFQRQAFGEKDRLFTKAVKRAQEEARTAAASPEVQTPSELGQVIGLIAVGGVGEAFPVITEQVLSELAGHFARQSAEEKKKFEDFLIRALLEIRSPRLLRAIQEQLMDLGVFAFHAECHGDWTSDYFQAVDEARHQFMRFIRESTGDRRVTNRDDRENLEQIFLRLAENVGHIGEGHRMVITVRRGEIDGRLSLRVESIDNGGGFKLDIRQSAKVGVTTQGDREEGGLGLHVLTTIVSAAPSGSRLTIESQGQESVTWSDQGRSVSTAPVTAGIKGSHFRIDYALSQTGLGQRGSASATYLSAALVLAPLALLLYYAFGLATLGMILGGLVVGIGILRIIFKATPMSWEPNQGSRSLMLFMTLHLGWIFALIPGLMLFSIFQPGMEENSLFAQAFFGFLQWGPFAAWGVMVLSALLGNNRMDRILALMTSREAWTKGRGAQNAKMQDLTPPVNLGGLIGKLFLDNQGQHVATGPVTATETRGEDGVVTVTFTSDQGQPLYTESGFEAHATVTGDADPLTFEQLGLASQTAREVLAKHPGLAGHIQQFQGKRVRVISDGSDIRGYSSGNVVYLREALLKDPIALSHELGEGYFAQNPQELPDGVNAHTYLRGVGKDVREIASSHEALLAMTEGRAEDLIAILQRNLPANRHNPAEFALIRYNASQNRTGRALLHGLQDRLYGEDTNDAFSERLRENGSDQIRNVFGGPSIQDIIARRGLGGRDLRLLFPDLVLRGPAGLKETFAPIPLTMPSLDRAPPVSARIRELLENVSRLSPEEREELFEALSTAEFNVRGPLPFARDTTFSLELELLVRDQITEEDLGALELSSEERALWDAKKELPKSKWDQARARVLERIRSMLPVGWRIEEISTNTLEIKSANTGGVYHENTFGDWEGLKHGLQNLQRVLPGGFYSAHMHIGRKSLTEGASASLIPGIPYGRFDDRKFDRGRFGRAVKVFEAQWRALMGYAYRAPRGAISAVGEDAVHKKEGLESHSAMINLSYQYPTIEVKIVSGLLGRHSQASGSARHFDVSRLQEDLWPLFTLLESVSTEFDSLPLATLGIPALAGDKPSMKQILRFADAVYGRDVVGKAIALKRFLALREEAPGLPEEERVRKNAVMAHQFYSIGLGVVYELHSDHEGWDERLTDHLMESSDLLERLARDLVAAKASDDTACGYFPQEFHETLRTALGNARVQAAVEEHGSLIKDWASRHREILSPGADELAGVLGVGGVQNPLSSSDLGRLDPSRRREEARINPRDWDRYFEPIFSGGIFEPKIKIKTEPLDIAALVEEMRRNQERAFADTLNQGLVIIISEKLSKKYPWLQRWVLKSSLFRSVFMFFVVMIARLMSVSPDFREWIEEILFSSKYQVQDINLLQGLDTNLVNPKPPKIQLPQDLVDRLTRGGKTGRTGENPPSEGGLIGKLFFDANHTRVAAGNISVTGPDANGMITFTSGGEPLFDRTGAPARARVTGPAQTFSFDQWLSRLTAEQRTSFDQEAPEGSPLRNHIRQFLSSQQVQVIESASMRGFSNGQVLYLTQKLLEYPIALFHELGEGYFASHSEELPPDVNAHTYLRGVGKDVREIASSDEALLAMTEGRAEDLITILQRNLPANRYNEAEFALIRYNASQGRTGRALLHGLQDRIFSEEANNAFSERLREKEITTLAQLREQIAKLAAEKASNPQEFLSAVGELLDRLFENEFEGMTSAQQSVVISEAAKEVREAVARISPEAHQVQASLIPMSLQERIIAGFVAKALPNDKNRTRERIQALLKNLSESAGPVWVSGGKIHGSLAWVRSVVSLMKEAGLMEGQDQARQMSVMIRALILNGYVHQILGAGLSDSDRANILKSLPNNFRAQFEKRFGVWDAEEVLAQFISSLFTGENRDFFDDVSLDLESFLGGEVFPKILRKKVEKNSTQLAAELEANQKAKGLISKYQKDGHLDLMALLVDYRRALISRDAEKLAGFGSVAKILDPYLARDTTVWDLLGEGVENASDADAVLTRVVEEVEPSADVQGARVKNAFVIRSLVWMASGALRAWERFQKTVALGFESKRPRAYVFEIQTEQDLLGLAAAYYQMRSVDRKGSIILNTNLENGAILKWMRVLGLDESLLGKEIFAVNLTETAELEEIFEGVRKIGGLNMSGIVSTEDIVLVMSEQSKKNLKNIEPKKYKILVGKLGVDKDAHLVPDAMAIALILGSVNQAFEKGTMTQELKGRLTAFLLEVAREYFEEEDIRGKEVDQIISEIAETGYFKMPPWTNPLDSMMHQLAAQEAIETSA